ncbi:MAG: hypothetical protein ACREHD_18055, partial [Pirellulales bacterium]
LDGSHKKWCFATGLLFLLATAGYVWYALAMPGGPRGGSIVGMLYGIAGSALMLFAGLISLRKKVPAWPIGSAQTWLRGHIWFGLLSAVLILYHAGFRWGGTLEQALLLVMAAVIASGVIYLGVQQLLPRQMTARVPLETFYAQLPFECRLLQVEGDVAVAAVCGPVPVEGDQNVATESRLKSLGVKSRDRHQPLLAAVYRSTDIGNGDAPVSELSAPKQEKAAAGAGPTAAPVEHAEPSKAQPSSTAEKIALMRSLKHATPHPQEPVDKPAPLVAGDAGAQSHDPPPPAKLTAAEKIALMRAGKKPAKAPVAVSEGTPEPPSRDAPATAAEKKPLSAAEKIALMRAAKKPAAPTAAEPEPAPGPEHTGTVEAGGGEAKKPLSVAEKIPLMRAAKKPATPPVAK